MQKKYPLKQLIERKLSFQVEWNIYFAEFQDDDDTPGTDPNTDSDDPSNKKKKG
jgi:hypothetical protein